MRIKAGLKKENGRDEAAEEKGIGISSKIAEEKR